ncbi:MAG: fibronectin type III domain-containing protein [Dehalococcoidia bacterium]|nr:fibronectin type III domain-containing protein [Dehalococcoidia bacterium]
MKTISKLLPTLLALATILGLVTTMPMTAYAATPSAPTNLTATTSANGIILSWEDNSTDEEGFFVERKEGSDEWETLHPGKYITGSGTVNKDVTTYTDLSATEGKRYTYRVAAFNSKVTVFGLLQDYSAYSNEVTITMVAAPTNLAATNSANGIILSWEDNSDIENSFVISRKVGNSGAWNTLFAMVDPNITTYTDTEVESGKTYYYKVRARSPRPSGMMLYFDDSGDSNTVEVVALTTEAPMITGPTSMALIEGYAATSTNAYSITGTPVPTVALDNNYEGKITWNNSTKKLDIATGLGVGSYPIVLTASNGTSPDDSITFTLSVTAASTTPTTMSATVTTETLATTMALAPTQPTMAASADATTIANTATTTPTTTEPTTSTNAAPSGTQDNGWSIDRIILVSIGGLLVLAIIVGIMVLRRR